ncbi:MAG: hypothetical protein Q4P18_01145 [Methanobrevibacter sp.]|uniref:hypothetical protein n=1 Tax=Methanobrevibacter sp. TaxID=66852 RepID=UPI0026DFD114|nr:hypothetical protein [Methanobrevibacter sp.]MDO5848120.1 hypothetical protein [Methanobrevibacter sp.]
MDFKMGNRLMFALMILLLIANIFEVSKSIFPVSYILEMMLFFISFLYLILCYQNKNEVYLARPGMIFSIFTIIMIIWAMFI